MKITEKLAREAYVTRRGQCRLWLGRSKVVEANVGEVNDLAPISQPNPLKNTVGIRIPNIQIPETSKTGHFSPVFEWFASLGRFIHKTVFYSKYKTTQAKKTIRNPNAIQNPDKVYHLKTGHVRFSDPHCIVFSFRYNGCLKVFSQMKRLRPVTFVVFLLILSQTKLKTLLATSCEQKGKFLKHCIHPTHYHVYFVMFLPHVKYRVRSFYHENEKCVKVAGINFSKLCL